MVCIISIVYKIKIILSFQLNLMNIINYNSNRLENIKKRIKWKIRNLIYFFFQCKLMKSIENESKFRLLIG